jgi:hypothetical protein
MNINWKILQLECKTSENGLTNVVYKVHWKCIAMETINEIQYISEMQGPLNIQSPDPSNFTPYESLTEEQVITWVQDTFGDIYTQEIYDSLQEDLNEQISPTKLYLTPPWESIT